MIRITLKTAQTELRAIGLEFAESKTRNPDSGIYQIQARKA